MKRPLIDTKHLLVSWRYPWRYRKIKFRHRRNAHSLYFQFMQLEVVLWYR